MTAFLDSSAVVRLLLDDEADDLDLADVAAAFGSIATSRLTFVETRAAVAAARRGGRLRPVAYDAALVQFDRMWATFHVIDLDADLAADAGAIAADLGLRAGDAIQLASMRALGSASVPLIAWDHRLRAAAISSGYRCFPSEV